MDDPASLSALFSGPILNFALEFPSIGSVTFNLFLVIALVLANGFFVASEFALVNVRRPKIETLAAEGDRAAIRLLRMLTELNAYVSATQLGITLSSLALGWFGGPAVAFVLEPFLSYFATMAGLPWLASGAVLHAVSFAIAFAFITFLHIVFGELAPKTAALELSEKVAFYVAIPLLVFYNFFYYPIRLLDWAGTKTAKAFGLRPAGEHGASYSGDDIRALVNASQDVGSLNEDERRLINQVFEFSETTVREAMVPRPEVLAIQAKCTLDELIEAFRSNGYSRLPVYNESLDDIRGVVHSKDILRFIGSPSSFRLEKILQRPMYVVDSARLEDVLGQMQREKFHFGFVVDEHGGVEGIITLEDLLEEIVGEISDEHDEEVNEQIHEQPDGSFVLDGGLAVRDLNKRLGLHLPISEAYTTIGGFLMSEAGQLLNEGDLVTFNGHSFQVEEAAKRRIVKIRMRATEKPEETEADTALAA